LPRPDEKYRSILVLHAKSEVFGVVVGVIELEGGFYLVVVVGPGSDGGPQRKKRRRRISI
jgi:hypothetical protein